MIKPSDIRLDFLISPSLDLSGYKILISEINVDHPLYKQFSIAITKLGFTEQSADIQKIPEEVLQKVLADYYALHCESIEKQGRNAEMQWTKCKMRFLNFCDELFGNKPFITKVSYKAYPSIWNVYIHQIKDGAISFPFADEIKQKDETIYVILHELLHVFFYQYIDTLEGFNQRKDLWYVAEIFNSIVLDQPRFKVLYPTFDSINYPMHEKIIKLLKDVIEPVIADDIIKRIVTALDSC